MSKQLVLSALALATLALNACSSEPSDWRPDKKVSVDLVEPGTRSDEHFGNGATEGEEPSQAKGGAIAEPLNSGTTLDEPNQNKRVTAEEVRTPDARDAAETNSPEAVRSVRKKAANAATQAVEEKDTETNK